MTSENSVKKQLIVWLSVAPEHQEAFTRWYQDEYIPRFIMQVPGIQRVSRWRIRRTSTYLTVYEFGPESGVDDILAAIKSSSRDTDRAAWLDWEHRALTDFRDGVFEEVFILEPKRQSAPPRRA